MQKRKFASLKIAIITASIFVADTNAAEIQRSENSLRIEGKIVPTTDQLFAIKLSELLLDTPPEQEITVELNSPGGNVAAALGIAKVIRSTNRYAKIVTKVRANDMCGSACPLILFATSNFLIHDTSLLLFHQPTLKSADKASLQNEKQEIEKTVGYYLQEIQKRQPRLAKFLRDERVLDGVHGDVVLKGNQLKRLLVK